MKKAASIFLRTEIGQQDIALMIRWMDNPNITRYLNEDPHIVPALRQCGGEGQLLRYGITADAYLQQLRAQALKRA